MEEPGGPQSMGSLRVGQDSATSLSLSLSCIGEGNGNPLQCSCLENPRDGGAWWAAVYGVAKSRTQLKRLSSSSSSITSSQERPRRATPRPRSGRWPRWTGWISLQSKGLSRDLCLYFLILLLLPSRFSRFRLCATP